MATSFDVFLSHNGRDKPSVEHIAEKLRRAGMRPWLDKWELTPGGRWQDELAQGLNACRAFAYFLGPNGEGDWAREELDAARSRAANDREFRIFPVLLPGTPDPFDRTTMPPFLGHRTWVDLRRGLDDPTGFQAFINAIKGVPLGAPATIDVAVGASDVSPYRGLDAFDEADADIFFGREPDIQGLLERLKSSRFLAVLGPSGSGKSSLVRAGLVPALRRGALPGSQAWRIETIKPGARPAEAIAARLLAAGAGTSGMQGTLDGLLHDERTLHLASTLLLGERADARLVWVVDQAEELFTLCHDEAERRAVIDNLTYASSVPGGRTVVVLAMRADFYARAAAYPDLAAQISRSQHLVAPLTPDGIRDAIEEPARTVGLTFEEGLVGTILDDLEGQPGSLPLLQYALLELWKRRRGGMLTLEGYRESGGVEGAIAKRAEAIYAGFTPDEQAIVRRALLRLTQPGEGTEDTRRRASMRELVTRQDEAGEVDAVIGELTEARLLTTSADPATGEGLVDISHEALIRAWPRVREWLDEDRAGQRVLRRITDAAGEWQRLGRDEGLLFRGARLAEAQEWREANDAQLNDDERAFLDASADLADRERRAKERARRRVTVAAGTLAVVFLVLAGLAAIQWLGAEDERRTADEQRAAAEQARTEAETARTEADRRATEAEQQRAGAEQARAQEEQARAEAEAARREATGGSLAFRAEGAASAPDRALLLAVEATHRTDNPDVSALLLRELSAEPRLERFFGAQGPAVTWLVAGNAGRIAWVDAAGTVRVADVADPETVLAQVQLPAGDGAIAVTLSPDGRTIVVTGSPTVTAFDVATGAQRWRTTIPDTTRIVRAAWIDDATPRIAVAEWDGSVDLLDAATGELLRSTVPGETPLAGQTGLASFALAFDRSGTRYARAEQDGAIGVWDARTGEQLVAPMKRPKMGSTVVDGPYTVTDLGWAGNGAQLAILFNDGFGLMSGRSDIADTPQILGPISAVVPDGVRIVMTAQGGFIVASANQGLRFLPVEKLYQLGWEGIGARAFPAALDTLPGRSQVLAGYPDGRLAVYDLGDRFPLAQRLAVPAAPWGGPATDQAAAIRADGAAFSWWEQATGRIRIVDPSGADVVSPIPVDATYVEALALSADGTRLVAVEDRADPAASGGAAPWLVVRALPDGSVVAEERLDLFGTRIALTPDGQGLVVGDATGGLALRTTEDLAIRSQAIRTTGQGPITALEVSPDGTLVHAGTSLGFGPFQRASLITWDLSATTLPEPVPVDADRISAIAESADGGFMVVAGSDAQSITDGRLLVFRHGQGRTAGALGPPWDNANALRFAPDGRLLSGGPSGWYAWTVDPAAWASTACTIAARNLTVEEWRDALGDEPWQATCPDEPPPPDLVAPPASVPPAAALPSASPAG
ncbi:MAG: TIR domain-containing protein [Chloroflexota bacterium]